MFTPVRYIPKHSVHIVFKYALLCFTPSPKKVRRNFVETLSGTNSFVLDDAVRKINRFTQNRSTGSETLHSSSLDLKEVAVRMTGAQEMIAVQTHSASHTGNQK